MMGRGGRHKHHLEEPVRHGGVAVLQNGTLGRFVAGEQCHLVGGGAVEEIERTNQAADIDVHQVVADEEVHQPGDGVEADVLQANHRRVLGAHGAGFEHREAGAHPHHQSTPDQERKGVEDELRFLAHIRRRDGGRKKQSPSPAQAVRPARRVDSLSVFAVYLWIGAAKVPVEQNRAERVRVPGSLIAGAALPTIAYGLRS